MSSAVMPRCAVSRRTYNCVHEARGSIQVDVGLHPEVPVVVLGLAAIAGAFARFLFIDGAGGATVAIEDAARFSNDQIFELARFVEQVSPQALQQFAGWSLRVLWELRRSVGRPSFFSSGPCQAPRVQVH